VIIDLSGKTAVVTGGASGIGQAVARGLAGAGASVAILDRNMAGATATAATLPGENCAFEVDLLDRAAVQAVRADVVAALGIPQIVVNAAGWDIIENFLDNSREYWDRILGINLMGPIEVTRVFLELMVDKGEGGRIVNVASDAGRVGSSGEAVYAGAKGGVIAFGKSLAREVARFGITVNTVCPGPTDTPLFRSQPEKMQEALTRAIPLRRLAQPTEVASAIVFFASDQAAFMTGQVVSVSGGLTMAG
jgi:2-hydroxycyclohexanecarboxyl-CoA dehydrogenase